MTSLEFGDAEIPRDEIPPELDPCEKCGIQPKAAYSGRGPKPRYCTGCKKTSTGSGVPRVKGQNQALAAQATQALMQINNFATLGLMVAQLHATANKWSEEINAESFRQSIYEALILDPELCRWICRGGIKSGKIALIIAYSMAAAAVVPTAVAEIKEKREAKEETPEEPDARIVEARQVWSAAS